MMIEINLLAEEFRKENKKKNTDLNCCICLVSLFFAIILFIHLSLAVFTILQSNHLNILNRKWRVLEPQRKLIENLKQESTFFSEGAKIIQQLTNQRITWAEKLNKLSLCLPPGVWFNEISFESAAFILKASVISLEQKDMELINKFLDNLKKDTGFSNVFIKLELDSVQKKTLGGYEISQFVLVGVLK